MKLNFILLTTVAILIMSTAVLPSTGSVIQASNSEELRKAINSAKPGDLIQLLPVIYEGEFVLKANSPQKHKITIQGTTSDDLNEHTTLKGSGSVLTVAKGSWKIKSLSIVSKEVGVAIKGDGNVLDGVSINAHKAGVLIHGDENLIKSVSIVNAKKGIQVKGDRNVISATSVIKADDGIIIKGKKNKLLSVSCQDISQVGITIKDKSKKTVVKSTSATGQDKSLKLEKKSADAEFDESSFDSDVEIKGSGNEFHDCTMQKDTDLSGCDNKIILSSVNKLHMNPSCHNELKSTTVNEKM